MITSQQLLLWSTEAVLALRNARIFSLYELHLRRHTKDADRLSVDKTNGQLIMTRFCSTFVHWSVVALVTISSPFAKAQEGASMPHPDFPADIAAVMKPLSAVAVNRCGLNLFYPALKNFFDQEMDPGCAGKYQNGGTTHHSLQAFRINRQS